MHACLGLFWPQALPMPFLARCSVSRSSLTASASVVVVTKWYRRRLVPFIECIKLSRHTTVHHVYINIAFTISIDLEIL